tara:strand:- start:199 stop:423 length:225 start_codon:yes stop_codon:yes gene_type:complete
MAIPDLGGMDISKANQMKCEKCENPTFKQTLMLHKMSALVSPNGQETIVPAAVFGCEKCGHVNSEFTKTDLIQQ